MYKTCRRVSHWAPDLARTLRTRYLPEAVRRFPLCLRILISRFAWKWGTLAEMLERELLGRHIDSEEPEVFWPNGIVHGNY